MSQDRATLHCSIQALRRTRDQLEPMVEAGSADVRDRWEALEKRWRSLELQAKHLTRGAENVLDGVSDMVGENVAELRSGYDRLASVLRKPSSESLWRRVRKSLHRLLEGGHRTSERVADSVEELAGAATARIKKAQLERTHANKRAELGTRVYELAKEAGRFEGGRPQVLDDDEVKALLQDLGSLDADLRNAGYEILEPDRIEA